MTEEQKKLKEHFLEPEVRDGVPVSKELKAVWKVMLDMLEEFIRICNKYDLKFYMDGGSLLGAIRHKGFIPWDDDMDVAVPRKDFERFLQVASQELKYPYFCQYTTTDPRHIQGFACLRNSATTAIDNGWARQKACFNMGIGIDIFPLDDIPDDDSALKRMIKFQRAVIQRIFINYYCPHREGLRRLLQMICICLYKIFGVERIVKLRDEVWGRYNGKGCARCSTISYNFGREKAIHDKTVYAKQLKVPFEYLTVCIPVGYETYLTTLYGKNWRIPIRGCGDHEDLIVDAHRPYKEILVERFCYKKEWVENLP